MNESQPNDYFNFLSWLKNANKTTALEIVNQKCFSNEILQVFWEKKLFALNFVTKEQGKHELFIYEIENS